MLPTMYSNNNNWIPSIFNDFFADPWVPSKIAGTAPAINVSEDNKEYKVEVQRMASDSLPMVKDETEQKFVDNRITLRVLRADGSVAISKTFTKASFNDYIDANYRQTGILEGLVFDKVDNQYLEFAASVSLPQTDEYIPLEVKIDNFGHVTIKRDSEMDTNGDNGGNDDEDEV